MLHNNNRLYLSVFNANPGENQGITTYEYNIDNIDCFAIMNKPIFENATLEQLYVVFKTKDGTYYTDFQFEENVEVTISKINNIIDSENANVYIDEVGIPIDENDFEAINDYNEEIEDYEEEIINEEIEEEILNDEFNEEAE